MSIYLKNYLLCQLKYIPREMYVLKKLHNTIHDWGETFLWCLSPGRGGAEAARQSPTSPRPRIPAHSLRASVRWATLAWANTEHRGLQNSHAHGSPAGQLPNLSVHQRKEQLWPCWCKTSEELLGSTQCKTRLKTHGPPQTTIKTSLLFLFPRWQSSGSGKYTSFHTQVNRAGEAALLCKYRMWHWNEELWQKRTEEPLSCGTGSSGGSDVVVMALSGWPWQSCVFYRSQSSSLSSKPAPAETPTVMSGWVSKILKEFNNERQCPSISVQHPSVLQAKLLATAETLHYEFFNGFIKYYLETSKDI